MIQSKQQVCDSKDKKID